MICDKGDPERLKKSLEVLSAFGMTNGLAAALTREAPAKSRFLRRQPTQQYVYASGIGVFEPLAKPGDEVKAGPEVALIHATQKPWMAPEIVRFENSGIFLCRRLPARTQIGDCLFNIGVEVSSAGI